MAKKTTEDDTTQDKEGTKTTEEVTNTNEESPNEDTTAEVATTTETEGEVQTEQESATTENGTANETPTTEDPKTDEATTTGETENETEVRTVKKPKKKEEETATDTTAENEEQHVKEDKEPKKEKPKKNKKSKGVTLHEYLEYRINARLSQELNNKKLPVKELDLTGEDSVTAFIKKHALTPDEAVILLVTLIPYIQPNFLDNTLNKFLATTKNASGDFIEFGSVKGKNYRGIIPTGETALYILAGNHIEERLKYMNYMLYTSKLFKEGIISMGSVPLGEPPMSGKLFLDEEYVSLFTTGTVSTPKLSASPLPRASRS